MQKLTNQAEKTYKAKRWSETLQSVTKAIDIASNSLRLHQIRVDCFLALGDINGATNDLKWVFVQFDACHLTNVQSHSTYPAIDPIRLASEARTSDVLLPRQARSLA